MLYETKYYKDKEYLILKNYSPTDKEIYEFFCEWVLRDKRRL